MELSEKRFEKLNEYTRKFKFAHPYNVSSIAKSEFPDISQVKSFYNNRKTGLNRTPWNEVLRWYEQDIKYISKNKKNINGINLIKTENKIDTFDLCLIDGSEFTGLMELKYLIGTKYILLDDTETYKCREAFEELDRNEKYSLIQHEPNVRNGFAVFQKTSHD